MPPKEMGKLPRHAGASLVWLSQYTPQKEESLPLAWMGNGANPIAIFTGENGYYFGGKGGRGTVNHGNMDGGSFIFELNGVRWVVDPGNQSYHALEKTGFNLWGSCQDCQRWTLLTKNNFGHSTLSVNNALHINNGMAKIIDFKDGKKPEVTIEMTPTFKGQLASAQRRFVKDGSTSLLIEDQIETINETELVSWQLMTTAKVEMIKGGAILHQDGKQLKIENLSHPDMLISIITLDPPPLELDRRIEGLKRIEYRYPAYLLKEGKNTISIRLAAID